MFPQGLAAAIGTIVALLITLAVFSRLLGESWLFKLIQCLFIGLTSGYILALVLRTVLWPRLMLLIQQPLQYWHYIVFFILGLLLLTRGLNRGGAWSSLPLGILFGLGAALTLGGSLAGTLIPQTLTLVTSMNISPSGANLSGWLLLVNGILVALGTFAVLGSFQTELPNRGVIKAAARIWSFMGKTLGRGLIMVTLGALYAAALVSFFTLLVSRLQFIQQAVAQVLRFFGVSI